MKKSLLIFFIAITSLYLFSCEAEHSNPLDPLNSDFAFGGIDGFILTPDRLPISGARILWKNQNLISSSDTNGYYSISDVIRGDGWVIFEKNGFRKDSLFVNWQKNEKNKKLDAKLLSFTIGSLDGYVFTPPRNAAQGVSVIWKNGNKVITTNENGYYKINDIPMENGMLYFEKYGLRRDSIYVQWSTENNIRIADKILSYNAGQILGSVKTTSLPRSGIKDVKVFWKNQNIIVQTDANGNYSINNVSYHNGWLYFEKEGYKNDSVFIQFGNQNITNVNDVFLNSIPKLDNVNISTTVIHRYTETRYRLSAQVRIIDSEGDVNLVRLKCDALNFDQQLFFNSSTGVYEANTDFGQKNISTGIGKDFFISVRENKDIFTIGVGRITRVIDKEVIPKEPINSAAVGDQPTFVWERFSPGFAFSYRIEIYTATIPSELYWSKSNISSDDVRLTPEMFFPKGEYYWVIWCVDEFNNQARSKEASFIVK